jgi:hypothetical protein
MALQMETHTRKDLRRRIVAHVAQLGPVFAEASTRAEAIAACERARSCRSC